MKKITSTVLTISVFCLISSPVFATDTNVISVITRPKRSPTLPGAVQLFTADGTNLSTSTLDSSYSDSEQRVVGDVHSNPGLEYLIYYTDYNDDTVGPLYNPIIITDQSNNTLDYIQPFSRTTSQSAVIAVGELTSTYDGLEIVTCRSYTLLPEVRVYNYSETAGTELVNTFYPFGERMTTMRGCSSLALGDVDGDGDQDIVVMRNSPRKKMRAFTVDGELIANIAIHTIDHNIDTNKLQLGDFDGDGIDSALLRSNASNDALYDLTVDATAAYGTILLDDVAGSRTIKDYAVGDLDNDSVDEVAVLLSGRKGKVEIVSGETVINTFLTDPTALYKRNRKIYLGAFSY